MFKLWCERGIRLKHTPDVQCFFDDVCDRCTKDSSSPIFPFRRVIRRSNLLSSIQSSLKNLFSYLFEPTLDPSHNLKQYLRHYLVISAGKSIPRRPVTGSIIRFI